MKTRAQREVAVGFSDAAWKRVEKKASAADLPVTVYVCDAALGRKLAAGSQLSRSCDVSAACKVLFTEGNRVGSSEHAKVLIEITNALERIAVDPDVL